MRRKSCLVLSLIIAVSVLVLTGVSCAQGPKTRDLILATTTSTVDSGLLDYLVPIFEKKTGYRVKTIAVGTGHALAMGEKGEADICLRTPNRPKRSLLTRGSSEITGW